MRRRKIMPKMCALIVIALLAASAGKPNSSAYASGAVLTHKSAMTQAVSLYEKLQSEDVSIPVGMEKTEMDSDLLKAVVLGYVNIDDAVKTSENTIRKQDMMNILYKTVINYDDSYALPAEEADAILNGCYDNAYIDDENRIAYAFMMKHGIISQKSGSEPNKEITEESCKILTDIIYKYFCKSFTVNTGDHDIVIGSNVKTVLDAFGEPNRIDVSEYGFDWYVYNSNYEDFVMVGVEADRVCAVYTNNSKFSAGSLKSGDDFAKTLKYEKDKNLTIYTDKNGRVDAIMYNPRMKGSESSDELSKAKAAELTDIINSYRTKNSKSVYVLSDEISEDSDWLLGEYIDGEEVGDDVFISRGYTVFDTYNEYLNTENRFIYNDNDKPVNIGVSAYIDTEKDSLVMCLVDDAESDAQIPQSYTVSINRELPVMKDVYEVTTPVLESPQSGTIYNEGDDVVIELAMQAAKEYHVEVFDIENDDYSVNEYIKTDSKRITLPAHLFRNGNDYRIKISSVSDDGTALPSDEVLISYGSVFDDGVKILTPFDGEGTDDDYLAVSWEADMYHDFRIDLYDAEGNLVTSDIVKDRHEALISGVDPGEYYVYVTALRRGTEVEKARSYIYCKVAMAEAVIEEIILDRNDKYFFVYEDKDLGVVYLYDEELVNVKENGKNVLKKKIIRKQAKATKAYRELAAKQIRREYTTGEPVLVPTTITASAEKGKAIVNLASQYLGVPYLWGGTTPNGFDCSGFAQYVMKAVGVNIRRTTQEQINDGVPVSKGDLQPGDLVFFESNGDVHHVGIYVGNGIMIHAPRTGDVIRYQSIDTPFYQKEYAGARRVY